LDHRPFDGVHRDSKPASGFSHGLTVGHRSHQAFFEVGRIRTHTVLRCISRACLWFAQIALEREHDNIRAALAWTRTRAAHAPRSDGVSVSRAGRDTLVPELETGLDLVGSLLWFWAMRGHLAEGRAWVEALLAIDRSAASAGAGEATAPASESSVVPNTPIAVAPGAQVVRARTLYAAGVLAHWQGDSAEAIAPLEQRVRLYRASSEYHGLLRALNNLGMVARSQGDLARAAAFFGESLAIARATDPSVVQMMLTNLAQVALSAGDLDLAQARSEEVRSLPNVKDFLHDAITLTAQALIACRRGQPERAAPLARRAQELYREAGDTWHYADGLEVCAIVQAVRGRAAQAARLLGAAAAHRERIGMRHPMEVPTLDDIEAGVAPVRAKLGEKRWVAAFAAGRALSLEAAIAEALGKGEEGVHS
jgi:tetratricopeptide (TPR) repeat protein